MRTTFMGEGLLDWVVIATVAGGMFVAGYASRPARSAPVTRSEIKACDQACEQSGGAIEVSSYECTCADGASQVWGR
jgi:hypothetical protein